MTTFMMNVNLVNKDILETFLDPHSVCINRVQLYILIYKPALSPWWLFLLFVLHPHCHPVLAGSDADHEEWPALALVKTHVINLLFSSQYQHKDISAQKHNFLVFERRRKKSLRMFLPGAL